uniref:BAH domain-containing protein n=1 Tax=Anopheles christyi TaxID=43041 RepID=A0A182JUZ9_9DIPT
MDGYYQPAGPLISPHLLGQPQSQHGPKSGPDGDTLLQSPQQPPASSTADSTDSDVLLTGTTGRPANDHPMGFHPLRPRAAVAVAAAAAAADDADRYFRSVFAGGGVDLGHRSQPYGASRYGPATVGGGGPPTNLYPRPMQMHCPPTYLPPGYYAPSPYGPQPPPPHGPPPEMYYTHAYSPHYYPKFAPPYYPTSRRYYPGPGPGPEHHLYEQAPPPSNAQGPPGPPPPPSGAQLVPAGPQGPQHLDHYPYSPYPGYGSPGPGSGGQCYSRNLQHPPPPPAYMDAHYTTNCPCPMQCPKNVNAGSLIGIKASKGPVATNNHIVQNQPSTRITTSEPITISSSSSSASSSSSPAPLDIHGLVTTTAITSVRQTVAEAESSPNAASKQQPHPSHGYHAHHHHGVPLPMEMHSQGPAVHHPHTYPYHYHHHHPSPLHHSHHGPLQTDVTRQKAAVTATSTSPATTISSATKHTPVATVSTAATGIDAHHPEKMCYKTELPIKPENATDLLWRAMHYGGPYHHPYHHAMGYYHHAKLTDLKEETHGTLTPPYSISSKMALLETPEMSPVRVSTALNVPSVVSLESLHKGVECGDKTHSKDDKLSDIPVSTAIVKQEIEEFKLLEPLVGTVCKKEDFEETGPAMTPDLLDESIVIKKDRDEMKPVDQSIYHPEHHPSVDHHHLHHHLQQVRGPSHLPHHLHHHSASTNLLHGSHHHHHNLHSHYNVQHQRQQQQPLITGLLVEKEDEKTDAKLPPDSKSLLTELVLTTEASMLETPKIARSILAASSTTATAAAPTSKMDVVDGVCKSPSQQPRVNSSDSSFNLRDSLIPNVAGTPEQLSSISKNIGKVQSHDSRAGSLDPPSPVPIPASTVKRRPLLVACKKATPKQSPPNSYKNLIKRTNGLVEDDDGLLPQCPEPVELSEEEEEEYEEEEEEEDEEDENDEENYEEAMQEEKVEDVEDIELQEQRLVEAEKLALHKEQAGDQNGRKQRLKKKSVLKRTNEQKRKGCRLKLLRTPTDKLQPKATPKTVSSVRTRTVKRFYRVFRSSIESLKRLPVSIRERLLRRSSVTLLSVRQSARKRLCKSQQQQQSQTTEETNHMFPLRETQPLAIEVASENDHAAAANGTFYNNLDLLPSNIRNIPTDTNNVVVNEANETAPTYVTVDAMVPTVSNVDRTIDLVAKGYFSEPEILNGTDLQMHSRGWLKKLKQQQQQEGRSHSEQSRGGKGRNRNGEENSKKCKAKCSPLAVDVTILDTQTASTKSKHSKPKSKSLKHTPVEKVEMVTPSKPECKDTQSNKKSITKERKKDPPSSRKRKQKVQTYDGDELSHASKRSPNHNSEPVVSTVETSYYRATSTPIPVPISDVSLAPSHDDHEEDGNKTAVMFDDSVVTLMDHSSVIDDRETDFDDAATMLVEDDVASVDTNVLVNPNNNNNNNNAITDKNSIIQEQQRIAAEQLALDAPIQAIIAEGKEGSELEPPEGMEPFMDEQLEEEGNVQLIVPNHQPEAMMPNDLQQSQPCPRAEFSLENQSALRLPLNYDDDYEELEEEELLPKRGSSRSVKRRRSRSKTKSKKFSTKKRHRPSTQRNIAAELEELIVPKNCSTIPRWSNGWTWEGQPFQGKVFLNSDDPPVLRTCYPAMRHSFGDIVKPRDCVLLKAGNKRAELPYVAKVAHLWENPDDGEMMMSLLWYYRPEHTEQGRQRTDGPDEVFASRHKDNNSVACIEDKCYVLTFSEYCRFRKQLKGIEENIEEQPSIVPPLRRENPRLPPPIVSPELVMYCQRVYEFRQKRLLKCTS